MFMLPVNKQSLANDNLMGTFDYDRCLKRASAKQQRRNALLRYARQGL